MTILHFPPQTELLSYLENHILTGKKHSPYFSENDRLKHVSEIFSNVVLDADRIESTVQIFLHYSHYEAKHPAINLKVFTMSLMKALSDCAIEHKKNNANPSGIAEKFQISRL